MIDETLDRSTCIIRGRVRMTLGLVHVHQLYSLRTGFLITLSGLITRGMIGQNFKVNIWSRDCY